MPSRVILAYSDDNQQSLTFLKKEIDLIYSLLNKSGENDFIPIAKPGITAENLFEEFNIRRKEITVFHFSGHAGQLELLFADQAIAGNGIAEMLKLAPNMELVFLNGCATKELIDHFHAAGVKRVIATSRKVYDEFASEFSVKFYSFLSQFGSVGESFDYAKAYMNTIKKHDYVENGTSRHIVTTEIASDTDEFPYGIYYAAQNANDVEKLDQWHLKQNGQAENAEDYKPCIKLIRSIGSKGITLVNLLKKQDSVTPLNAKERKEFADLAVIFSNFEATNKDISEATFLCDKITGLLPQPLGIPMRQMTSAAKDIKRQKNYAYMDLLKYQLKFYDVLVKLSCFTMLSDLFEVIQKKKARNDKLVFDSKLHNKIKTLLSLNESDIINFNYLDLIRSLRETILENEETPFVSEYMQLPKQVNEADLDMAHEVIKVNKIQFASGKITNSIASHCNAVENELVNIFEDVYFILRYSLLVIRNVEAIRFRFNPKHVYQHKVMLLRLGITSTFENHELENAEQFTENYSVILVKGLSHIIDYLSLAPFILDKCVLTIDEDSELYYYSHISDGAIVYEGVADSSRKITLKIATRKRTVSDGEGGLEEIDVSYIPFVEEELKKNPRLEIDKVTTRMLMVYEQFQFFKREIENISY